MVLIVQLMNRRAFVASSIGGLAVLCGCVSNSGEVGQTPRAYRTTWSTPGNQRITTLSVNSSRDIPSAQALIHGQDDAREVLRDVEPFSMIYTRYIEMDYEDRFVGVTALELPPDKTAWNEHTHLEDRTYSVTIELTSQEPSQTGPNWEYLLETWDLGEADLPQHTELQLVEKSSTRTTT